MLSSAPAPSFSASRACKQSSPFQNVTRKIIGVEEAIGSDPDRLRSATQGDVRVKVTKSFEVRLPYWSEKLPCRKAGRYIYRSLAPCQSIPIPIESGSTGDGSLCASSTYVTDVLRLLSNQYLDSPLPGPIANGNRD